YSYRNAARILSNAYGDDFSQITDSLMAFRIKTEEIVKPGGSKTEIAKNIENLFHPLGWNETRIRGDLHIRKVVAFKESREVKSGKNKGMLRTTRKTREELAIVRGFIDGHKIDFVKNSVAFDLEWNSKDQTFDRDLYAMRAFYECGIIS